MIAFNILYFFDFVGISNINNVKALYNLREIGISGVIIGKAIYEKKFDLSSLIKLSGN